MQACRSSYTCDSDSERKEPNAIDVPLAASHLTHFVYSSLPLEPIR